VFLGDKRGFVSVCTKSVFGLKMGVARFGLVVSRLFISGYGERGRRWKKA